MREGRTKTENRTAKDITLVAAIFIAAFFVFKQERRVAPAIDTPHVSIDPQTNSARPAAAKKGFTIQINSRTYRQNATISPAAPLMATFHHSNPAVTKIRMQHPQRPDLNIIYPLGQPVRIINHETYMRRGQLSSSEFLAQDAQGNVYDRILLEFKP